ncbi:MAG: hypothetical protein PSX36_11210 [bacterium]|nr:hypothetical protein [bacterium]
MIKLKVLILFLVIAFDIVAQNKDLSDTVKLPYFKKEEIIFEGKRYRIHNNYLTAGAGFGASSSRSTAQKNLALDYQFHIRMQQFQTGVLISGNDFGSTNFTQLHVGYGYRLEKNKTNFAFFAGPTYFTGVMGDTSTTAVIFDGFGLYSSVQVVYKVVYDIGLGLELFSDINYKQRMFGVKIIAFFSNAYRGPKRNINPNVRSENPR